MVELFHELRVQQQKRPPRYIVQQQAGLRARGG